MRNQSRFRILTVWRLGILAVWYDGSMSGLLFGREAREIYLNLEACCAKKYPDRIDARYVEEALQRVAQQLAINPHQSWLQRYRINWESRTRYVVVVPTATGVEHDAAIIWQFRPSDDRPVVLVIDLEYNR